MKIIFECSAKELVDIATAIARPTENKAITNRELMQKHLKKLSETSSNTSACDENAHNLSELTEAMIRLNNHLRK